jgi:hypothetical protein
MNVLRLHFEQAVVLGTTVYGCLAIAARLRDGAAASVSAAVDMLVGLVASWILMLAFLAVFVTPLQCALRRRAASMRKAVWAGALSGLVPAIALLVFAGGSGGNPLAGFLLGIPLAAAGGWFAFQLRRPSGPR